MDAEASIGSVYDGDNGDIWSGNKQNRAKGFNGGSSTQLNITKETLLGGDLLEFCFRNEFKWGFGITEDDSFNSGGRITIEFKKFVFKPYTPVLFEVTEATNSIFYKLLTSDVLDGFTNLDRLGQMRKMLDFYHTYWIRTIKILTRLIDTGVDLDPLLRLELNVGDPKIAPDIEFPKAEKAENEETRLTLTDYLNYLISGGVLPVGQNKVNQITAFKTLAIGPRPVKEGEKDVVLGDNENLLIELIRPKDPKKQTIYTKFKSLEEKYSNYAHQRVFAKVLTTAKPDAYFQYEPITILPQ